MIEQIVRAYYRTKWGGLRGLFRIKDKCHLTIQQRDALMDLILNECERRKSYDQQDVVLYSALGGSLIHDLVGYGIIALKK
jgi:hypothetical protein